MASEVFEFHSKKCEVRSTESVLETKSQNGITCTWSGQVLNNYESIKFTWKFNWDELMEKGVDELHGHIITRRTALTAAADVRIDFELTEECQTVEKTIVNVNRYDQPGVAFDYYLAPIYSEKIAYDKMFAASDRTDAILVVEGKKLNVNKAFLSFHSDFFTALFSSKFKEGQLPEIPIQDVSYEDFGLLISMIYPNQKFPSERTVEKLLELADRFLMPAVTRQVQYHLMHVSKQKFEYALWLADKYGMPELLQETIHSMTKEKAKQLETFSSYDELSADTTAPETSELKTVDQ